MMKKNKKLKGLVINVILKLTEKELIFLMLSEPQSLNDLCVMATLENQMLLENKL